MTLINKEPVYAQLLKGNNIILSALVVQLFQFNRQGFLCFSSCFTKNLSPLFAFRSAIPFVISRICSCKTILWRSKLIGIFSN